MLLAGCAVAVIIGLCPPSAAGQDYPLPTATLPNESLPVLTPFPVVRAVGRVTRRGVTFSRFTVRAPVGSTIRASCSSRRCPFRNRRQKIVSGTAGTTRVTHVPSLERSFRSGVTLRIYVMRAGFVGKYTSIGIRRGKLPRRYDRCVSAFDTAPISCDP